MIASVIIFDIEVFNNVFLFCGRVLKNRNVIAIWGHEDDAVEKLRDVMRSGCTFVSYNGIKFDMPVIAAFLAGFSQDKVKSIANSIIEDDVPPWQIERMFGIKIPNIDHIDLIEVAPSFVSLKAYGARMHMRWLKDLPYAHDAALDEEQCAKVEQYCVNDLDTTEELYRRLLPQLALREKMGAEYGIDMRSKSDAQMAESAFIKRLNLGRTKARVPYSITYEAPEFIEFESEPLKDLLHKIETHEYLMNQVTGHVMLPEFLAKGQVSVAGGTYQLGVGGIHSTHDKKVCHIASRDYLVFDIDAASYYPSIIINCNLIPRTTGKKFIDEYREIYNRRLEAKRSGDKVTSEVLKISLNSTFGKTSSRWSPLYSPDLALAITMTGQLTLLNLIEKLENLGANVLSANTDGIVVGCPATLLGDVQRAVTRFEERTRFEFEYTFYKALAMKDVNNYIAVTQDKKVKAKGIYAVVDTDRVTGRVTYKEDLKKNPTAPICAKAVAAWLRDGTPLENTIASGDFKEYLSVRGVTGGGVQGGEYLGRVVRWYQTKDDLPPLTYAKNGNKVAKSDGARACMVLPVEGIRPNDLDYNWYYREAITIAINVGCKDYLSEDELEVVKPPPKTRKPRAKKEPS